MFGNLLQTFVVRSDRVRNASVIFLTSVELNFDSVPSANNSNNQGLNDPGVSVCLVETEINGSGEIVPNLGRRIPGTFRSISSSVITTDAWTKFKFNGPVPIKPDVAYAIVVSFDADAAFVLNTKTVSTGVSTYQDGKLFVSSDVDLKPIPETDLAFKINCALFDTDSSGDELEILNDTFEFLQISNLSTPEDVEFLGDEHVVDANNSTYPAQNGTIAVSALNNRLLIGTGTIFDSTLAPGMKIVLANANTILTATDRYVVTVNNVISNTQAYITDTPQSVNSAFYYYKTPVAKFFGIKPLPKTAILWDSNAANAAFRFSANSYLYGLDSNTTCTVVSVDNFRVNKFKADFGIFTPPETNAVIRIALANTAYNWNESNFLNVIPMANNMYTSGRGMIASRSNEVINTGNLYDPGVSANSIFRYKSMVARAVLTTNNAYTSPHWKSDIARLILYSNQLNNSLVGETGRYGNCESKYVSKVVTLADGLDAEDIRVYLTLTKPANTDVAVYAKISHAADQGDFENHAWTKLSVKNTVFVNKLTEGVAQDEKTQEVIELQYGFDHRLDHNGNILTVANGAQFFVTVQTGNAIVITSQNPASGLPTALVANDMIGIYNPAYPDVHWITVVNSVVNTTAITTVTAPPSGVVQGGGMFIYKVQEEHKLSAFNNIFNQNVVRYFSKSLGVHDSYKAFAVKICLLSDDDMVEPVVYDCRAIAVSS